LRFLTRPVSVFQGGSNQKVTEAAALDFGGAANNGQSFRCNARFDARGSTGVGDRQHCEVSFRRNVR
jgi:hypothetical protein